MKVGGDYYQSLGAQRALPPRATNAPVSPSAVNRAEKVAITHAAPATLTKAYEHRNASALTDLTSVNFRDLQHEDKCHCCQYPFRGPGSQRFPICASLSDLKESGLGFPLFFLMIKVLAALLGIVLCVASVPNLAQNLHAGRQDEWGPKSDIAATSVGGNGKHHTDLRDWPVILNLVALVLLSVCYVALWLTLRRLAKLWNEEITTPSDYTIAIKNLDEDWSEEDLKAFIRDNMKIGEDSADIADMNTAFDINKLKKVMDEMMDLTVQYERTVLNFHTTLPEERPFRRCCCCSPHSNIHSEFITEEQYRDKMAVCEHEWQEEEKMLRKTGIAYVSLMKQKQVMRLLKTWKVSAAKRFLGALCCGKASLRFNGRIISIERAPEPTDIIWENLGYSHCQRVIRHICTMSVVCVILLCSFWILYGLAGWQKNLRDDMNSSEEKSNSNKDKVMAGFSSIPVAAIIYVFNIVLNVAVRLLSTYERNHTYTDLSLSVAIKLTIVLSVNTLIFPILVHKDDSEWYVAGGLANNIFWVAISAAFVKPIFKLCGPMLIWQSCRRREVRKVIENNTAYVSQAKANSIFQYPEADLASWYSEPVIKFLLTLAYTPLLPLIVPITLIGFLLEHWVDKFYLLKVSGKPRQMDEKIALSMLNFVQPAFVLYGISILLFFSDVNRHTRLIGVIAVIFACAFWVFHSFVFTAFCKKSKRSDDDPKPYSEATKEFSSVFGTQSYKKANPYTRYQVFSKSQSSPSEVLLNPTWQSLYFNEIYKLPGTAHHDLAAQGEFAVTSAKQEGDSRLKLKESEYSQAQRVTDNIYPSLLDD